MTARATHARTDVPADSGNPDEIQPSDFIADHVLEDVASAADLAALLAHVGGGSTTPVPSTILGDDGTGYSEWKDSETWLVSYERRVRTVNARIQAPALNSLGTDPIVLVPAPGVGYFVRVVGGLAVYSFGSVPFSVAGLIIEGGAVTWAEIGNAMTSNANTLLPIDTETLGDRQDPGWTIENAPIVLTASSVSGGDGQLDIWLDYMVLPMPVVD